MEFEVQELKNKILQLQKSNSEKSSKTIWETTQEKIKDRDETIESLKREIEILKNIFRI